MPNAYRDDLAYIHDVGYGGFAKTAAPWLLEALRHGVTSPGLVIDLGCGSGIWSRALSDASYDVLGIDISPAMIALARKRAPKGQFRVASFLTAELPACVAVTALGECFNYLFDSRNSDQEMLKLFRRVYEVVCPGGLFIFDVAEPGRVLGSGSHSHCREGKDWAVLVAAEEDRQQRLLTRRITSFRKVGEVYRRDHEVHRLRLYVGAELARQLRGIGFKVRILRGYGALRFAPGYVGVLARKK